MNQVGDFAVRSDVANVAVNDGFSRERSVSSALDVNVKHERSVGGKSANLAVQRSFVLLGDNKALVIASRHVYVVPDLRIEIHLSKIEDY